jgi:hypothetical protein
MRASFIDGVLETRVSVGLQFYGIGDGQNEWLEIHLQEMKKPAGFCLGVRDLFTLLCGGGVHSFVSVLLLTRQIAIVQR